jgi:hypothetical protein
MTRPYRDIFWCHCRCIVCFVCGKMYLRNVNYIIGKVLNIVTYQTNWLVITFIYCLFNDSIGSSENIALNDMIIIE